jgi:hypothetical protein
MNGRGDAAQTTELAAAVQRLAALADRVRELRDRLAGVASPGGSSREPGTPPETAADDRAKGEAR